MKSVPFMKFRVPSLVFSLIIIIGFAALTIYQGGFNFSIDLRSGIAMEVMLADDSMGELELREALTDVFEKTPDVQVIGGEGSRYNIKITLEDVDDFKTVAEERVRDMLPGVEIQQNRFISANTAATLSKGTYIAIIGALVLILLYAWFRFKLNFAIAAIIALVHDVFFLLGFIGAFQVEFSAATIAAILTIIGYSLNDTIVIFDRIRENTDIMKETDYAKVVDASITQSLSRTIITSFTTLLAVFSIFFIAYGTVKTVALGLIVGVIVGTYSSIFIASSFALFWHERVQRKLLKREESSTKSFQPQQKESSSENGEKTVSNIEHIKQSAEEIRELTRKKAEKREKRRKKKK